jgi:hypothetical protein
MHEQRVIAFRHCQLLCAATPKKWLLSLRHRLFEYSTEIAWRQPLFFNGSKRYKDLSAAPRKVRLHSDYGFGEYSPSGRAVRSATLRSRLRCGAAVTVTLRCPCFAKDQPAHPCAGARHSVARPCGGVRRRAAHLRALARHRRVKDAAVSVGHRNTSVKRIRWRLPVQGFSRSCI